MNFDCAIIGGGVAGQALAAELAPHASVCVLEMEAQLGYHASGRSAAMFLAEYGNEIVRALNRASADQLSTLGVLKAKSMMLLAKTGEEDAFETEHRAFQMDRISMSEAKTLFPIIDTQTCITAGFREDIFELDADLMMQKLQKRARAHGVQFITGEPVKSIRPGGNSWILKTPSQTISATVLVNAAGAWVDEVAELAGAQPLGFQPYRRSMARLPAPGGHDVSSWPFVDGVNEGWYAKPDAGKWLVSPQEEDPMAPFDAYADDMVLAEGLARYQDYVTEDVTRVEYSWAGLRTFAPDRALVLGADVELPGFFWCGGQGGYGFQTALAASTMLAEEILGQRPSFESGLRTALSPARFST
ncbi:MAG: FAD-dependent oxidoreductase [Pseudomonadota bacterium]